MEQPPVEQPPVEQPPVEQPPVEEPPVPQAPTNPTPSDAGSQPVLAPVDAGTAPEDTKGGTTSEPVTSAPNYDPVLGSGTDPPASEPADESTTLVTLAERIDNLAGQAGGVLGSLARALDGLLGGDGTPKPADGGMVQLLAGFSERVGGLVHAVGDVLGGLGHALGALLGGGAPNGGGGPIFPPDAPIPGFPGSPGGPSHENSIFSGASVGSGGASAPLFGAIALLSLALMRGGKPWWLRGEALKPKSALRLAIERPG